MARHRKSAHHLRELYYIVIILLVAVVATFSMWGPGGYTVLRKARAGLETHRALVESLRRSNSAHLMSVKALRSDRGAIERYAREKGYARRDELVQPLRRNPEAK
jgi:cell division protein FtsB